MRANCLKLKCGYCKICIKKFEIYTNCHDGYGNCPDCNERTRLYNVNEKRY